MAAAALLDGLLTAPPGSTPYTLQMDPTRWSLQQLWSPAGFVWKVGSTPFADLQVILLSWIAYATVILSLRAYMSTREPFKLRLVTAVHNMILCVWSLAMFGGALVEIIRRAATLGVDEVFCTTDANSLRGPLFYTTYIYYLSKYYELLDTVILVLKKKPLIFLHWYHHAIVILMVWSWLEFGVTFSSLGMLANTLVHVFMYYYYYASSLGQNVWFKKYITMGQIVQFSTSFLLSIPYLYYHFQKGCEGWNAFVFSSVVNASFLLLFMDFYRRSYRAGAAKKGDKGKQKGEKKSQ
ncbi:GNS1/SUR4 family-domain-containing protein [Zopfochytrium polystomum]|nr:GNS1/SUR4 family-domain-containing protein [Zopfochytrium polystomum]